LFFSVLIQNPFDSMKAFISSQVVGCHLLSLLEVVKSSNRVLHAFVNVRYVQSSLHIVWVQLQSLFVMNQGILVISIVIEGTSKVKVAL
jgi:hypothetical protein